MYAIRGATTLEKDDEFEVKIRSAELFAEILRANGITVDEIVHIVISTTADITSFYPATAVREAGGVDSTPLFSCLEPPIKGALPLCVRFLVTVNGDKKPKHVYLREAAGLRRDLAR